MVPIYLTLTVTVQKDGSLNYEYTDLYYKKDNKKTKSEDSTEVTGD